MTTSYSFKGINLTTVTLGALILLLGILSSGVYALPLESNEKRYTDNGDGTTTFTFGKFTDSQSAELMLEEVLDEGVASAKVIATKNGAEISLEEAKQLLGE